MENEEKDFLSGEIVIKPIILPAHEVEKAKIGRPTIYTEEVGRWICDEIATTTRSGRKVCESIGISYVTFMTWLRTHEEFLSQYRIAKALQQENFVDEAIEITDEEIAPGDMAGANRNKTRAEMRFKIAQVLAPKVYGTKQDINITTTTTHNLNEDQFSKLLSNVKPVPQIGEYTDYTEVDERSSDVDNNQD